MRRETAKKKNHFDLKTIFRHDLIIQRFIVIKQASPGRFFLSVNSGVGRYQWYCKTCPQGMIFLLFTYLNISCPRLSWSAWVPIVGRNSPCTAGYDLRLHEDKFPIMGSGACKAEGKHFLLLQGYKGGECLGGEEVCLDGFTQRG